MLLDANIFLEAALAQEHGWACKTILERPRDGKIDAGVTDFHVDSIVLVMESYGKGWREISIFRRQDKGNHGHEGLWPRFR